MISTAHPSPQPKRHPYRFIRLCTDDRSVPILYNGMHILPPKFAPFHGDLDPHLIHGSPGPPKSSIQTAAQLVQPFLQGSLVWRDRQTDRPTDHATRSVRTGCIYVRSTAMRPNNNKWQWWMQMVASFTSGLMAQVSWLGVSSHPTQSAFIKCSGLEMERVYSKGKDK